MNVLLVVESPIKAKKFREYFPEFKVISTIGHFQDLPVDRMGVEPPDHKPEWVVIDGKQRIKSELIAAAKNADVIYIATDPDREGESIAAHVANTLGKAAASKVSRVTYNKVSKAALSEAINNKRAINWPLVRAQEARRVIDRYVGYQVSPELTKKLKPLGNTGFLTSGRVQSVSVKLVVEREEEIKRFVPVQHFGITVSLEKSSISFFANWKPILIEGGLVTSKKMAQEVIDRTQILKVISVNSKPKSVLPPKPLTTSAYVRLMAAALKLTTKQAMDAAQKLFESGLITYHRTDSPSMAEDAVASIRSFAKANRLPVPSVQRDYKAAANAQEGHECLRVTDINLQDARTHGLADTLLQAVYNLVWKVTLESQLSDGIDIATMATFENAHKDTFVSHARSVKEAGWRQAAKQFIATDDAKEAVASLDQPGAPKESEAIQSRLPALDVGEQLRPLKIDLKSKTTEPPERFTEKTLVEKLDKLGIGRPSTYASTIERIIKVGYITRAKNLRLDPTPRGVASKLALDGNFSFMDYGYTAKIEESFDSIANRKTDYLTVVTAAWNSLERELNAFKAAPLPSSLNSIELGATAKDEGEISKKSKSTSKSAVSKTATSKTSPSEKSTAKSSAKKMPGDKCPECTNGTLSMRKFKEGGKNAGKSFVGCSNFPTCKYFSWPH